MKLQKKYMKKNPPINEQMIKTMMTQMGRTPSQKQVNQMMKAMKSYLKQKKRLQKKKQRKRKRIRNMNRMMTILIQELQLGRRKKKNKRMN